MPLRAHTSSEFALVPIHRVVLLHFHPQIRVCQPDPIARGRAEHRGVLRHGSVSPSPDDHRLTTSRSISGTEPSDTDSCFLCRNPPFSTISLMNPSRLLSSNTPLPSPEPPERSFLPPTSTRDTVFRSPGSKRTAVPAAISRRVP